jgi:hypothetical protein
MHIMPTMLLNIRHAICFSNTTKKLVKKFKGRSIWWRSMNYFIFFLFYIVNLHFVPLVLNLVPIALHLIWEISIYDIYECFPIIPFKRLAIVFLIILGSTRSNKNKKLAFALDLPILSSLLTKPSSLQNPNSKGLIQNVMMDFLYSPSKR